jgi:hypothetical protein
MNRTDGGACYPTQRNRLRPFFLAQPVPQKCGPMELCARIIS